jgi:hypothetical protein
MTKAVGRSTNLRFRRFNEQVHRQLFGRAGWAQDERLDQLLRGCAAAAVDQYGGARAPQMLQLFARQRKAS